MLSHYERERDTAKQRWMVGLRGEVGFWEDWIRSDYGGSQAFSELLDPKRPLESKFTALIDAPAGASIKILDVGAGPLTALGPTWDGRDVRVRAVDPLADEYRRALEKRGLVPPTWTERGDAEQLSRLFQASEFDFVYATNCLDHSYDPLRAFREIVTVLRPGCFALLDHAQNEAVAQEYAGLHQWNFDVHEEEFVLWRPGVRVFVQDALADVCTVDFTLSDYLPGRKRIALRLQKLRSGGDPVKARHSGPVELFAVPPAAPTLPLRYRIVDRLNDLVRRSSIVHAALKRVGSLLVR